MIDWTIFDQYPENTVECRCGVAYRSHTKAVIGDDGQLHVHSRVPCPGCGVAVDGMRSIRSDPEEFVIGKKDT